jgi:hypothetical protein
MLKTAKWLKKSSNKLATKENLKVITVSYPFLKGEHLSIICDYLPNVERIMCLHDMQEQCWSYKDNSIKKDDNSYQSIFNFARLTHLNSFWARVYTYIFITLKYTDGVI